MVRKTKARQRKLTAEIKRQELQETDVLQRLLKNVNGVQGMVNETRKVFEGTELFQGREIVLTALNVLNNRLGIARMRSCRRALKQDRQASRKTERPMQ